MMFMALPSFAKDTITVKRAGFVSDRGTQVRDWSKAKTHTVAGCSVQMRDTETTYDAREAIVVRAVLYAPPTADLAAGDLVTFDSVEYAIDGVPFLMKSPTGRVSHKKAILVDWRG